MLFVKKSLRIEGMDIENLDFNSIEQGKPLKDTFNITDEMMDEFIDICENLIDEKKFEDAAAAYLFLSMLDPLYSDFYVGRARALQELERYDEALELYSMAMLYDADDPFPHLYSAQCYLSKNDYKWAKHCTAVALMLIEDDQKYNELKEKAQILLESIKLEEEIQP